MEFLQMMLERLWFDFKWMSYRTMDPAEALINLHTTSYDLIIISMKDVSSDFLKQEQDRLKVPIFNLISFLSLQLIENKHLELSA